jgi:hypothetical protein
MIRLSFVILYERFANDAKQRQVTPAFLNSPAK